MKEDGGGEDLAGLDTLTGEAGEEAATAEGSVLQIIEQAPEISPTAAKPWMWRSTTSMMGPRRRPARGWVEFQLQSWKGP